MKNSTVVKELSTGSEYVVGREIEGFVELVNQYGMGGRIISKDELQDTSKYSVDKKDNRDPWEVNFLA